MFKKVIIFLFILFFLGCPKNEECISLKEAEEIVLYEIVGADTMEWDSTKIRVYELPYRLKAGDTIILRREDEMSTEQFVDTVIAPKDYWYFFRDDCPLCDWEHWCTHIFVYCDGEYEVIERVLAPPKYWDEMIEISW